MGRLFGRFWPLTIAQSHTPVAAVLVDEVDASRSVIIFAFSASEGAPLRPPHFLEELNARSLEGTFNFLSGLFSPTQVAVRSL